MRRKESEIVNRPGKLLKSCVKTDEQLLEESRETRADQQASLSNKLFNKSYGQITETDLHKAVEEMIQSLYLLRKNIPFNIVDLLNLIISHPRLRLIDRNVSL
jgi:hypothetical protein